MSQYVALIADRTCRYATVYGEAISWNSFHDQLEDAGCEVIENQTEDYDGYWPEEFEEDGVLTIHQLLTQSDFVAHP